MTVQTKLLRNVTKRLSQTDRTALDQPIKVTELNYAVQGLQDIKSPGIDDIPSEIYKTFWSLRDLYMEVFNK